MVILYFLYIFAAFTATERDYCGFCAALPENSAPKGK